MSSNPDRVGHHPKPTKPNITYPTLTQPNLILSISDATGRDGERDLALRQLWTVVYFSDPCLTTPLTEGHPGGGGVSQDMSPYGLLRVGLEGHGSTRVGSHLVSDYHRYVVLFADLLQSRQVLRQLLLPVCQLSATTVVYTEQSHDTVHDKQLKYSTLFVELAGHMVEYLELVIRREGTCVEHVIEYRVLLQVEAVRYGT